MRICYLGRGSRGKKPTPEGSDDVLELLWDNWDDHNYKTSFQTTCRIRGELVDLGSIRLLTSIGNTTYEILNQLLKSGWNGIFPVPDLDYISVPLEISFYQQLKAHLGGNEVIEVAKTFRDASYLTRSLEDEAALNLVSSEGFGVSLQRERGSISAYLDGWKVLESQVIAVQNFQFRFQNVFEELSTLAFNFASASILPHDINVLIGANGVGKSRVLHQIVESWNRPSNNECGFAEQPNLSQVVIVSYSPFERFPIDMEAMKVRDKQAYRYFGFRGRSPNTQDGKLGKIRLSHEFPKTDAAQSLIGCLADDQKFKAITDWAKKIQTMETVLRTAFQFDFAAVEIDLNKRVRYLYSSVDEIVSSLRIDHDGRRYVPVTSNTMNFLKIDNLLAACIFKSGVTFFKDGIPIELSSGQRLFAYIVINLLGVIRRNSLVLIDEPELFLHPTLEIQFIEMLKEILVNFNSKALLATHSEVIVREVPASCVHVFQRTEDGLNISQPPFQTFGGDIQRISSYVFGDKNVSKPFEKWLEQKLEELGSAHALIEAMGNDLSEEVIVQIKAMERNYQWL